MYTHTRAHTCVYTLYGFFLKNLCFPQSFFNSDTNPRAPLWFKSLGYRKAAPRDAEQPAKEGPWHSAPAWQKPWLDPISPLPIQNIFLELFDLKKNLFFFFFFLNHFDFHTKAYQG